MRKLFFLFAEATFGIVLLAHSGQAQVASAAPALTPKTAAAHVARLRGNPATLRHIAEIRRLTPEQAGQSRPVLILGTVTSFLGTPGFFFLQDASGAICIDRTENLVDLSGSRRLEVGDQVEISGLTDPGMFAPVVDSETIRIIGHGIIPPPRRMTYLQMVRGNADSQWTEIEGIVRAATVQISKGKSILLLNVDLGGGSIAIRVEQAADYKTLVDAQVKVVGVCGTIFNNKRQIVGLRMWTPAMTDVKVTQRASNDPAAYPLTAVRSVMQFSLDPKQGHRVKVAGTVTYQNLGHSLYLQDGPDGILIQSPQTTPVPIGTRVEAVGFPSPGEYSPVLKDAIFRTLRQEAPAKPLSTDADHVFQNSYELDMAPFDSQLIQLKGEIVERVNQTGQWVWIVRDGKTIFEVHAQQAAFPHASEVRDGSTFLFTGICVVQVNGEKVPQSFHLLLRSPADMVLLQGASVWTRTRILLVLGVVAATTLLSLLGIFVLTRRVKQQTDVIRTSEERFRYLAQHDALTGLANRLLLNDRLEAALAQARRHSSGLALMLLDLDNFKHVNDSLGHAAGDQLLCLAATRIAELVRETDTVARMGGDEFVVLFTELDDPAEAERIAQKILASLAKPMLLTGQEVPVSGSAGIAIFPEGGVDANSLMQNADSAMYQAKARGRNAYALYSPGMSSDKIDKLALQMALARAVERNELRLQFQPMVNFSTGRVIGFEALLRWHSEKFGLVMPDNFIPLAEQTGLIVPVGEWVLHQACMEIAQLEQRTGRSFLLAVNISPRQVQKGNLPRIVQQALARSARPAAGLELELTESILMHDSVGARDTLQQLRDMNVRLAIDDFGIGFSSLSYIMRFAIHRIKIDRSFVANCVLNRNSNTIARTLIAMAQGLDIEVVAEGIETAEIYDFLRSQHCDIAQGYYISRPVDASVLESTINLWESASGAAPIQQLTAFTSQRHECLAPL